MIQIKQYQPSIAMTVGSNLKKPLFKLISNTLGAATPKPWESKIKRIGKIAFQVFIDILLIIPASIAWLAGKAISSFSRTQVDLDGLTLAPSPIQTPNEVDDSVDIYQLFQKFEELKLENQQVEGKTSKKDCLERLCKWTKEENYNIFQDSPSKRKLFCKQLKIYLQGIINKINSGSLDTEKVKEIILELAEGATRCYPTWLAVAAKYYSELYGGQETVEAKIVRHIQEYKESLILNFTSSFGYDWHALNFMRNTLGQELGLDTSQNNLDPYGAESDSIYGRDICKSLFMQEYANTNRIILSLQTKINSSDYDQSIYDFVLEIAKQLTTQEPENYVAENFYDEEYKITFEAVNLMLRQLGILR